VQLNSRAELAVDEFATADLAYDSAGRLVQGRAGDPFYRFHKRASQPTPNL
jgi:hypothetical protein